MTNSQEHLEIWKQIKGSQQLFEIYTYYPTLHDARIKNVEIDFETKEFSLTVDYCDFIKEPGDEISTRITVVWLGIQKADFNYCAEYIIGMNFQKIGNFIKTNFEEYSSGFYGEVISIGIEIRKIEVEPKEFDGDFESVKFIIN